MKNGITFSLLAIILLISACGSKNEESQDNSESTDSTATTIGLKLKWESDTLLTTCESVIYDQANDILYVSNINGSPDERKATGFISKLSLDGKIETLKWVTDLVVPTGLGIHGGKLYVAEAEQVTAIDIASGNKIKSFPVQGAKFLNDITTDAQGKIYISDSQAGLLAIIENDNLSIWLDSLDSPNGLFAEEGRLLSALWNPKTLNTVDLETGEYIARTEGIENPDGIEAVGDGGYLVSSWNGIIHYVNSSWEKEVILDTQAEKISAADIEFIIEKKLVLVPTFFSNKVVAYELMK